MAIISTTEVKAYLGITSTTYDTLIGYYVPMVLTEFFDYTNNWFDNNSVYLRSAQITADATAMTIVIDGTNFSTCSFVSGDEIRVRGSKRNDGYYTATTVSSATITVSASSDYVATHTLKDEAEYEATWVINKVDVPVSVKPILAAMVKYKLDHPTGLPKSESLGDYSVVYCGGAYPEHIIKSMDNYRLVRYS